MVKGGEIKEWDIRVRGEEGRSSRKRRSRRMREREISPR